MKRYKKMLVLISLAMLLLVGVGCSNFGYQNGVVTVDVSLSADTLNSIVSSIDIKNDFVGKIDKIELIEPNIMRITGDFRLVGKEAHKGSIDLAITNDKDGVKVTVVKSTAPGVDKDNKAVQAFNNALEGALNAFASKGGDGGVTDVRVKNGELVFTVSVKVK